MNRVLDVEDFLSWLNEAEEELKKERRKDDQIDKRDDGILVATEIVREYVEKMCRIDSSEKIREDEHCTGCFGAANGDCSECRYNKAPNNRWISCSEILPEPGQYVLVSFENAGITLPAIAMYEVDEKGSGAFYPEDGDVTFSSIGVFINAWMSLPELYKGDRDEHK